MESLARRGNHLVSLRSALLCAAAFACLLFGGCPPIGEAAAVESQPPKSAASGSLPVVSGARLAGDEKQTRFILDLDKPISIHAFPLADPYRIVLDIPQVTFQLPSGVGNTGRGLIKAFRYGMVMPGGSRIVFDLTGPAKITNASVLEAANGQPPRLVLELEQLDRTGFVQALPPASRPELRPALVETKDVSVAVAAVPSRPDEPAAPSVAADSRPMIVIDPGHGGPDNGTQWDGASEKTLVLAFALSLRDSIEKSGKYRVAMTRTDDTFIPLDDRVKFARGQSASLFVSIHADALPRREGDAQGASIYTLSDRASDAEAERLAEIENKADAIGGVNLTEEPTEVADILIDLARRETRTFSSRFAHLLMADMKTATRMHKNPLKSAGFRVLKAPDVPSVLVELGYVSNKDDLGHLASESWRARTVGAVAHAIDTFFDKRLATAGNGN